MRYCFGIDLGTTNSCIGVMRGNENGMTAEIINVDTKRTVPSCIEWLGGEDYIVGLDAYKRREQSNVIYSVKRDMGTDHKVVFVKDDSGVLTEKQLRSIKNKAQKSGVLGEQVINGYSCKVITPEEASSLILKKMMASAKTDFGYDVENCVVTVPADFKDKQRGATKEAMRLAGLNCDMSKIMINEPTAAAIAYGLDKTDTQETILVYDLGGGTLDITILNVTPSFEGSNSSDWDDPLGLDSGSSSSIISVLASEGDNQLGGDDIDNTMLEIIIEKVIASGVNRDNLTPKVLESIKLELESAKKTLDRMGDDGNTAIILELEKYKDTNGNPINYKHIIDPNFIAEASEKVINKSFSVMNKCLNSCSAKIDRVVLNGGSTKSLYLRKRIANRFKDVPVCDALNPDESVAQGASIQCMANSDPDSISIFDVTQQHIGVEMTVKRDDGKETQGVFSRMIAKNTLLPASYIQRYQMENSGSDKLRVSVYTGSNKYVADNEHLGDLIIDKVGEYVDVRLSIDVNGLLKCEVIKPNGDTEVKQLRGIFNAETKHESIEDKKIKNWRRNLAKWQASTEECKTFEELLTKDMKELQKFMQGLSSKYNKKDLDALNELKQNAMDAQNAKVGE